MYRYLRQISIVIIMMMIITIKLLVILKKNLIMIIIMIIITIMPIIMISSVDQNDPHDQDGEGSSALHVVTERLQEATEEEAQKLVRVRPLSVPFNF